MTGHGPNALLVAIVVKGLKDSGGSMKRMSGDSGVVLTWPAGVRDIQTGVLHTEPHTDQTADPATSDMLVHFAARFGLAVEDA